MNKKYNIIYVDPPWAYSRNYGGNPKNGGFQYPSLTVYDLVTLRVDEIAAKNAALLFWVTAPKLEDAFPIIVSWGFHYKTVAFDWRKVDSKGKPRCGLGHYSRSSHEFCLLAIRGSMKRMDANVMQTIDYPVTKHSAKPPEVRDRIVRLFGDLPRIELFARDRVQGWDSVGLDLSGKDIRTELDELIQGTWKQS